MTDKNNQHKFKYVKKTSGLIEQEVFYWTESVDIFTVGSVQVYPY